ncbi:MAG: pentapeptide repeat-containing protein [Coleofasciculaceae cyanobacterium]
MSKQFYWWVFFLAVLLPFMLEVASSSSLATTDSNLNLPVCYMQTEDGKVLDLGNLCQVPASNNINSTNRVAGVKRLLDTKECPGCNLSGANLANKVLTFVNLSNANLSGANLTGARLIGADLSNTNLTNANLKGAKLNGARMIGTNLIGTNLAGANLLGANLWNTDLAGANLNSTKMPDGTFHK